MTGSFHHLQLNKCENYELCFLRLAILCELTVFSYILLGCELAGNLAPGERGKTKQGNSELC